MTSDRVEMALVHTLLLNQVLMSEVHILTLVLVRTTEHVHHEASLLLALSGHIDTLEERLKGGVIEHTDVEIVDGGFNSSMSTQALEQSILRSSLLAENEGLGGGNDSDDFSDEILADAKVEKGILEMTSDRVEMALVHTLLLNQVLMSEVHILTLVLVRTTEHVHHEASLLLALSGHIDTLEERLKGGVIEHTDVEIVDGGFNSSMSTQALEQSLLWCSFLTKNKRLRGSYDSDDFSHQILLNPQRKESILKMTCNLVEMHLSHALLLNQVLVCGVHIFTLVLLGTTKDIHHEAGLFLALS